MIKDKSDEIIKILTDKFFLSATEELKDIKDINLISDILLNASSSILISSLFNIISEDHKNIDVFSQILGKFYNHTQLMIMENLHRPIKH